MRTVAYFRQEADRCRALAQQMRPDEARERMLSVAEAWETLANKREADLLAGVGASPGLSETHDDRLAGIKPMPVPPDRPDTKGDRSLVLPSDPNETLRLQALEEIDPEKFMSDPALDQITAFARERFAVPICLVTIIEAQRQLLLSRQGLDITETPRSLSFCTYAILRPQVLVVPDARLDERFRANPLVTGEPFVRFYAGAPLMYKDDVRLGALCLVGYEPQSFSEQDQAELARLADQAVSVIVARATGQPLPAFDAFDQRGGDRR